MRYTESRKIGITVILVIFLLAIRSFLILVQPFIAGSLAVDVLGESSVLLLISLLILYGVSTTGRFFSGTSKEKRRALAYTDTLYRTLFNQSPDGVVLFNARGELIEFNETANRQLGYTREEFKTLRISDIDPVERPVDTQKSFEKVMQEGHHSFAVKHVTKQGEIRDVLVIAQKIEVDGEILFPAIWRDITEHQKAEEALRESEDKFRSIFEKAMDGIMIADAETKRQINANKSMCSMLGYSHEELVGLHMDDIHPKEALPAIRELFEKQRRGEISLVSDVPMLRKDGSILYADINATKVTLEGKPCLVGIFRDITERKQKEEKIRESQDLLRESQTIARLGSYMLDIPSGLWSSTDVLDEVFGINEKYERSVEGWLALIHPEDRKMMADYFRNKVLGQGMPFDSEYRIIRYADGAERWVHGLGKLECDVEGKPLKMHGTIQDITERKKLEEQLLQTQKLESIGTLAGGIAHDFNNLLQGVFGYASMAKEVTDQPEKVTELLGEVEKALSLSVNLTTQLLTFAKGGLPVKKRTDLKPKIENATKFALSGSRCDYQLHLEPHLWPVEVDEGQIAQVIQNIVLNASEAMPEGGEVTISAENLELEHGERQIRIAIKDTGTGIPESYRAKVFDPYFTTKPKGSGLGLATSYSIVKNHNGLLEIDSTDHEGTTFLITLPACESETKEERVKDAPTVRQQQKLRVLLMDDEAMIRDVAKSMLEALGHEIELACHGEETIGKFQGAYVSGKPFDLVILDLTIKGGMGGEETIKKLLEIDPNVWAVVSSGYSDSQVVSGYQDSGFKGLLKKPYTIQELKDCLDGFFGP